MKKFFTKGALIITALLLAGCTQATGGGDGGGGNGKPAGYSNVSVSNISEILGTWQATMSTTVNESGMSITVNAKAIFTFEADKITIVAEIDYADIIQQLATLTDMTTEEFWAMMKASSPPPEDGVTITFKDPFIMATELKVTDQNDINEIKAQLYTHLTDSTKLLLQYSDPELGITDWVIFGKVF